MTHHLLSRAVFTSVLFILLNVHLVDARIAIQYYDNECRELPTPGYPIGSDCRCNAKPQLDGQCDRDVWDGLSMCIGYPVGSECQSGHTVVDPNTYSVEIQDSVFKSLIANESGDTLPTNHYSAAYEVHQVYDSCRVVYTFAELWQGTERLELANWNYDHFETSKTAAQLSALSGSKPFTVSGDSISYYREVAWFDPRPTHRDRRIDNFYCRDSLTYIVSVVRDSTNQSIEVDRLFVTGDGNGHLVANTAPMEGVKFKAPNGWNGATAHIKIDIIVEGNGEYNPGRMDNVVGRISNALTEPFYTSYYKQFNENYLSTELE